MRLIDELQSLGFVPDGTVKMERSYLDQSEMPERQRLRYGDWFVTVGERWVNFYQRGKNNAMVNVRRCDRKDRDKIVSTAREICEGSAG